MKCNITFLAAALAFGTCAVTADDKSSISEQDAKNSHVSSVRLSKLMDANIQSNSGEDLGKLEDVVVDPRSGQIKFAVLGRGGFLGLGEKLVPVPWKAIQVKSEKQFTLNVDKEKLKTAPTTDKEYSRLIDPGYTVTIYRFFAVPADAGMGGADDPSGLQQGKSSSTQTNQGLDQLKSSSDTTHDDPDNTDDNE